MKEIPIHNDGAETRYVSGLAIAPGETRLVAVHESLIHPPKVDEPAVEATSEDKPRDPLQALLDDNVSDVKAAINATNPDGSPLVSDEDLASLLTVEETGRARKTLIEALRREILDRAAVATLNTE